MTFEQWWSTIGHDTILSPGPRESSAAQRYEQCLRQTCAACWNAALDEAIRRAKTHTSVGDDPNDPHEEGQIGVSELESLRVTP
jgi:hypothetical protein